MKAKGFECFNCKNFVPVNREMGTFHRNHCPFCLHSRHVDLKRGDRKSDCLGKMEPIALTFKKEGKDKYGKERQGELMIVHRCLECRKISINRIAADDSAQAIMEVFKKSFKLPEDIKDTIRENGIEILEEKDRKEIETQLYGRK
ncbi:RNHCP domain-containing protein [Candidatus Microgenomates bacterium]|jgi:hypothetical protein|nr:MAG: RNHCP domain-containing protein [Candidatus Microgenomates bacterium]